MRGVAWENDTKFDPDECGAAECFLRDLSVDLLADELEGSSISFIGAVVLKQSTLQICVK